MDAVPESFTFNGKPVITDSGSVHLFCENTENGDLYIKHQRKGDEYYTEWYIKDGKNNLKTRRVPSKNSLAIDNSKRDNKLIKFAKDRFNLDVEEHLKNAGEFINENTSRIFPSKKNLLLNRSKKDAQLIRLTNELDEKFKIVLNRLTGQIHVYNKEDGIYRSYNEKAFSAFLTDEYGVKFLADEVNKIMGIFSEIRDESENYIAFKNCLLNLDTLETEAFTSKEFVTFQVPYNWNPEAKSEYFEDRIRDILVDEERFEQFLQMVGYCFTNKNPHNKMFFITGDGANGKTTLMSIIKKIFGESVTAVGLHQFDKEFGLQPLLGKRINILSDLPKMTIEDTGYIKAVTGEDSITVNQKYKEPITSILGCKIIGTGNQLPQVKDDTHAFWRRVIHFELTNRFNDPQVKKTLLNDNEGIEWLIYESIKAYKRVETEGWACEKTEAEIREEYLKLSNPCLYAAEQIYEKTNDPKDYVTREETVNTISSIFKTTN